MVSKKTLALLATILGSGIVFLDGTVVSLALPAIDRDLGAHFSDLQWIANGYLLSLSALLLLGGSLGDIFGRKKIYLLGLGGFGVFSLLCGLAPSTDLLIASRFLQGIFGALLVPGSLAIINTNFAADERGKAIGQWSAWAAAFTAIGPLLGGYLIDAASWRWIFLVNIPLILACMFLVVKYVEESQAETYRKLDITGAVLAALSLAGVTYGLIQGPVEGWHTNSVTALIAGFIFAAAFIWNERTSRDPMVPLTLFKSRNFAGANLMTFTMYGALSGFLFAIVIYLQTKMGYSAIKAGMSMLPVTILLLLLSSKAGNLATKYGPRFFMTSGPIIAGVGILLLFNLKPGGSYLTYLLPCVTLFGVGMALMVAPLTMTVMASVHKSNSGIASAINNTVTRVGGLLVVAVLGLLGVDCVFRFSMALCGVLAILSGAVALVTIKDSQDAKNAQKELAEEII
jgi:EmrB/QacA subfamily drug resistance transporter